MINQNQNLTQMTDALAQFINNPNKQKVEETIGYLKNLCNISYKGGRIKFKSDAYCAYSGEKITPESNLIVIEGYTFIQQKVAEYYIRGGILDISIGDLQFQSFRTQFETVVIPLSEQLLQQLYGANLNKLLEEANSHYAKRLNEPIEFECAKTKQKYFNSEKIRIGSEDISIYWAIENLDKITAQLTEPQRKYIESQRKLFASLNPMQSQILSSQQIQQSVY